MEEKVSRYIRAIPPCLSGAPTMVLSAPESHFIWSMKLIILPVLSFWTVFYRSGEELYFGCYHSWKSETFPWYLLCTYLV